MTQFYVYQLRIEGEEQPFYVGKGRGRRMFHHCHPKDLEKALTYKARKINKALSEGKKVFPEVIEENLLEEDALILEAYYIAAYGRTVNGGILTNATDGGEGVSGYKASAETKRKLSKASKGRKVSDDTKAKTSKRFKNIPLSEHHRKKLADAKTGKPGNRRRFSEADILHIILLHFEGVLNKTIGRIMGYTGDIARIIKGISYRDIVIKYKDVA